jgi:hypothetical protein
MNMDKQKVAVVLLIIAILFSLGTVYVALSSNADGLVPTNTVTTIQNGKGTIGLQIEEPPTEGSG